MPVTAHILLCATLICISVSLLPTWAIWSHRKRILYSPIVPRVLPYVWQAFITYLLDEIVEVLVLHSYIPEVLSILQTSNFHVSILLMLLYDLFRVLELEFKLSLSLPQSLCFPLTVPQEVAQYSFIWLRTQPLNQISLQPIKNNDIL